MSKIIRYLPELQDDEQLHVATLYRDMTDEQAEQFARVYRQRRKETNITLATGLVFLLGFAGIQRLYLGQVGMGLLYVFTWGLCGIGQIVDLVRHKELTYRYNQRQAEEVAMLVRGAFPSAPKALSEGSADG